MPSKLSTTSGVLACALSVVLLAGCGAATSGTDAPAPAQAPGAMGPAGPAPAADPSESVQEGSPAGDPSGEETVTPSVSASPEESTSGTSKTKVDKFLDTEPEDIPEDFLPEVAAMEEIVGVKLANPEPLWSKSRYNQMVGAQAAYSTAGYTAEKESPFGIGVGVTSGPTYDYVLEEFKKVNWKILEEKDGITYLSIESVIPSGEGQVDYIIVSAFLPVDGYLANASCTWTAPQNVEIDMEKIATCAGELAKLVAKKPV